MSVQLSYATADVFRHGAAGKSGWRVWTALTIAEAMSAKTLASALGMHVPTVQRALARLRDYDLARADAPGLWVRGHADPATVVPAGRQAGAGQRQRKQHKAQRFAYGEFLARRGSSDRGRR